MLAAGREPLTGSPEQFCAAFYHIEDTPEAGQPEMCLCRRPCPRKTVCLIARLQRASDDGGWREAYLARYVNCYRGSGTTNLHAEHFLTQDPQLDAAVRGLGGPGRLTLYLTYQPCHKSGGHDVATMGSAYTSCTELLIRHLRTHLAPHGVEIDVAVAYIYRAHWREGMYPKKYAPVVASAREGLRLLFAAGIGVRAFGAEDWGFLASHGDGSLVSAWARGAPADSGDDEYLAAGASMAGAVFTPEVLEARKAMDRFVGEILREVLAGDAAGPPCEECTDADGDALNAAHARLDEIIDGEAE